MVTSLPSGLESKQDLLKCKITYSQKDKSSQSNNDNCVCFLTVGHKIYWNPTVTKIIKYNGLKIKKYLNTWMSL